MRLDRLELTRFGKFSDCGIELPAGEPDLHLIIGRNEAGKSTLRAALVDLLFGIEARSAYNFIHPYSDMCLGAVVTHDDERLAFRRLKRNRDSLRDAGDRPLADERLAAFLGPVDRAFFERMFALDRRRLEEGGVEILKAKNDLGRMLFEASAGLASLGPLRQALEAEADALWGPRKKQSRAYTVAFTKFDEAGRRRRETMVRARDWQQAARAVEEAGAALDEAVGRHQQLEAIRERLDRVRRVAPHLRAREERMAERVALGDVVLLPTDAEAALKTAEETLARQATVMAQQEALVARAEAERERIVVDQAVLARHEAIVRLGEERNRVRDHPLGIEKRQAELQVLRDDVARLIRELGWTMASEEELAQRLPTRLVRAEIQGLLKDHAGLVEAERLSAETVASLQRDLAAGDHELASVSDQSEPAELITVLKRARGLGDVEARRGELAKVAAAAHQRLTAALADLAPWNGDVVTLRGLSLPAPEAIQAQRQAEEEIGARLRTVQAQAHDAAQALDVLRLTEAQIRRDRQPVTADAITAARAEREALWMDIREGRLAPAVAAADYQGRVAHADDLADRRFLAAADTEKLEQVRAQIEQDELKQRQRDAVRITAEAERDQRAESWRARLPQDLAGLAAAALPGWLDRRRRALDAADQLATAEDDGAGFDARVTTATSALKAALAEAGAPFPAERSHSSLLAAAEAFVAAVEKQRTRREELSKQRQKLARQLGEQEAEAKRAASALADWRARWAERLTAIHLSADLAPSAVTAALDLHTDLAKKLAEIDDLRRARIATMQRDLDDYATKAAALAAELAPELAGQPADSVAIALSHRLSEAEKAKERLERVVADRAEALKSITEARSAQQQAEATLQPLADRAGTTGLEDLRMAIERSAKATALDDAIAAATGQILEGGDGLSLADLTAEVAAEDLPTIGARLAEIEAQREAARAAREERRLAVDAASRQLAAIDGASTAAEAEAVRQEALAEMAMASERYLTVFVASKLLGWAIDRFRAEKQDPLLRRAGDIFRGLTLGSFAALTVDYDGEAPLLMGRRGDGSHVGVDGMSEGTRDQLYLALRLAAIELHLARSRPLPFIADDLFVNFDDARAAAGFRALAELAGQTQVIFLSHHEHLVEVAQGAIGEGMRITAL